MVQDMTTKTVYYEHSGCGGNLIPRQVSGTYTMGSDKVIKWQPNGTPGVHFPAVFKCDKCNRIGEIMHLPKRGNGRHGL